MVSLYRLNGTISSLVELSEHQKQELQKYLNCELLDNVYGHTLAGIIGLDKHWQLDTWDSYTNNRGYIYFSYSNPEKQICNFYKLDTHK